MTHPLTNPPWFVFSGGGTGGHLYPALGVVRALREVCPDATFTFFATRRPIDGRVLGDSGCGHIRQDVRPLRATPWTWPGFALALGRARRGAQQRFTARRPSIVVGTGGFASAPAVLAAEKMGIPTAMLNPDARPGKANRWLAGRVDVVFAQWEATREAAPRSATIEVLGCPVRPGFGRVSRPDGCAAFGLDPDRPTLLVTGASQGARSINEAVPRLAAMLRARPAWQILHLTGDAEFAEVQRRYEEAGLAAKVLAYTSEMPEALAAADLVLSRAGASTLAEISAAGVASVLMPYPYDRGRHQHANAECLAAAGAASVVDDRREAAANAAALEPVLSAIIDDDEHRSRMASCARAIGRPDAACEIAARLLELAGIARAENTRETLQATCGAGR
jgi:UDP-N-acetylglucosamine--N-acetylmuramyl-(pentapeptide) pyrophosphoryl-undecaprenol N-acetylglucosamine transferase